jgi:hypothetical protein
MSTVEIVTSIAAVFAIALAIVSWVVGDTKAKTTAASTDALVSAMQAQFQAHVVAYEGAKAESKSDRENLHREVERLRAEKASKEVLDGLREDFKALRDDMDKRFDRLETLVRGGKA